VAHLRLSGSRVLLTGASGGLGGPIARALRARGAHLLLSGRREQALRELADELGGQVELAPADLARADEVARLAERAAGVDVFVAGAGLPASGRLESFTPEEIDRALDVNLRAPIQLARALVPAMVEKGAGHVVLLSSLAGKVATPRIPIYAATKFGLRGFALALRQDLHGTGVGVTAVFPAMVRGGGMFPEDEVELPPGMGTSTRDEVARAVVRGIERDRAEVDVAPLSQRAGALASTLSPSLSAAVQRRLGAVEVAESFARAQASKR
jgi:short-subunit dehydrogenase